MRAKNFVTRGQISGLATVLVTVTLSACSADAATLIGPEPYLQFSDSPFNGMAFDYFYLEDYEDGLFNVPGVTGVSNTPGFTLVPGTPNLNADSVDGDDGVIDGFGRNGRELTATPNGSTDHLGYTFSFDAGVLGILPSHVGIVWTDGSMSALTQVEFFGSMGESLGIIGPVKISDNSFAGTTAEDRFFGAVDLAGISRFVIRSPNGMNNLSVDHLQYGYALVPEPSGLILVPIAAAAGSLVRRRSRGWTRHELNSLHFAWSQRSVSSSTCRIERHDTTCRQQ